MQDLNITDIFLDKICSIAARNLPVSAEKMLRTCLVDTLGVTYAGAKDLYGKEIKLLTLVDDQSEVVSPIGFDKKTSIANAILINGLSSHYLELDDGVRYGVIHPSAPLFSALLPIVQRYDIPWELFAKGATCGYETSIRIASAMQPSHYSRGYHPTATCCTLGVAVGIGVMLNYSVEDIKNCFGAATISACGSLKALEDVSELKPYNCAKAALMGYYATMIGKAGFCGPSDALSGDTGFFKMMCDDYDKERLIGDWDKLAIEKIYQKPYASCRHTHPAIEACLKIRQMEGFDAKNVEKVEIITYKGVIGMHDFKEIHGESSARMSIPYSAIIALLTGKAGIAEFAEPYLSNPDILSMMQKVDIIPDDDLSRMVPDKRVAIVRLCMRNGNVLTERVEYPKGEPENPLTKEENMAKFISMTKHAGLDHEHAQRIFDEIINTEIPDFKQLW